MKTVLANCSNKGRVELCVMKSHIRKQSLRKLLSNFFMSIVPFSQWAPMGCQISLCKIHDNSVIKLFQKGNGEFLCDEFTHQKAMSERASLFLLYEDISFITMGPNGLPNITLQLPRRVLANCLLRSKL